MAVRVTATYAVENIFAIQFLEHIRTGDWCEKGMRQDGGVRSVTFGQLKKCKYLLSITAHAHAHARK